jgi:hypothetical protein
VQTPTISVPLFTIFPHPRSDSPDLDLGEDDDGLGGPGRSLTDVLSSSNHIPRHDLFSQEHRESSHQRNAAFLSLPPLVRKDYPAGYNGQALLPRSVDGESMELIVCPNGVSFNNKFLLKPVLAYDADLGQFQNGEVSEELWKYKDQLEIAPFDRRNVDYPGQQI